MIKDKIVKIQRSSGQTFVTIPKKVARRINNFDMLEVSFNEQTGLIECRPVRIVQN